MLTDNQKKKVILSLGLFFLFFILMYAYRHIGIFTDEGDNVLGGMVVANGGIIYKDFYSQHTPVMYYICGLFNLLGADGILEMRVYCYALLSFIWVIMFFRYSPFFGKLPLIGYPIFYIISMACFDGLGHMVLSEQIQAQALVVLFLELLLYINGEKIRISNAVFISIAIFASIGTAFMSILAVLVVILAVIVLEIKNNIVIKRGFFKGVACFFKKYSVLILIVLCPFFLIMMYYFANGILRNAYEQAIYLNLKIYPLFNGTAESSGIFDTVKAIFSSYFTTFQSTFDTFFEKPFNSTRILFNFLVNAFFCVYVYKKDKVASFFIFAFIIAMGPRGYAGFHAIPYWAMTEIMFLILIQKYTEKNKMKEINTFNHYNHVIAIMLVMVIIAPYMSIFPNIIPEKKDYVKEQAAKNTVDYYIQKLTNENDKIQISSLNNIWYIENDRLPASKHMYAYTPWFTMAYEDKIVEDLKETTPKLVQYDDSMEVWGYNILQYAPIYCEYIKNNYTPLNSELQIWVRNDYYNEAKDIIAKSN